MEQLPTNLQVLLQAAEYVERRERGKGESIVPGAQSVSRILPSPSCVYFTMEGSIHS